MDRKKSWSRPAVVGAVVLLAVAVSVSAGVMRSTKASVLERSAGAAGRATPGAAGTSIEKPRAVAVHKGQVSPVVLRHPKPLHLTKAGSAVFDVRKLKSVVVKHERPERAAPGEVERAGQSDPDSSAGLPATVSPGTIAAPNAPAPGPDSSFDGLDFANWGAGHPPDTNGDVGPTYYIETVNTSIGIYNKSTGTRVAAFTFNSFMSQGHFGNLCDTNNFGDPVVLYDSFEDRWFITDFAFALDGSGNVSPQHVFQCFAVSKSGDPVNGGWNYYSIEDPGGLGDYPKFGVWPDGIYMSANMFGYGASDGFISPHVWALNKQQMYAGAPSPQVVDFVAPSSEFTMLPANARLQTGTPPAGSPNYFAVVWQFLNAISVYKFHVDWDKVSTSTLTGPFMATDTNWWAQYSGTNGDAPTPANANDTLYPRLMVQNQYTNIGGVESLWDSQTVGAGNPTSNVTSAQAAVRYYQLKLTGGNVEANTSQAFTYSPDTTMYRYMPSVAADRMGDMAIGYTTSNSTTNPGIKYAGRLAGDANNTITQSEQTLFQGTGAQSGNCGSSACTRWGDYSAMTLDPNGCEYWYTNEYYATTGLNDLTRIGSFHFPSCTPVGNGSLSGTVTDGTNPLAGVTVALGSRTTSTDASGNYTFASLPAGTYPTLTATKNGFDPASTSTIVVPDGGSASKNFALNAAAQSGCFTDNSQTAFQRGTPNGCDLTSSPGNVILSNPTLVDQQNTNTTTSGFGFTSTSWAGQTFTAGTSGKLTQVDLDLFCSSCTGTTPNITVSIRATSGGVPTGSDLATATIPGFSSGAGGFFSAVFSTPLTVTAGTQYAIVFRSVSNPSAGTYAYVVSSPPSVYAGGSRVTSTTSGSSWTADTTRDLGFKTYVNAGFASSATFVSSLKDANPAAGSTPQWTTLSYAATVPAGTSVKFQIAASNSQYGPFNFVGPDGTASTFFTTSGASLSQFNGFRYLRYEAFLTTNSGSVTPSLSNVQVCFTDAAVATTATSLAVTAATGTFGGTTSLSAHLTTTPGGADVPSETVSFSLNGNPVGTATTNANGVATLINASLTGINAGSYATGVGASFAGDSTFNPSSGSAALTVNQANQAITVTTHAPANAAFNSQFTVAATGGASGNAVTFSSSGACSNTGATFTMTSGAGTCTVNYNQAGNANYNAAPQVTETTTATKANQTISVTTHAPANAPFNSQFTVAATGGGSGNPVTFSSSGACSNTGATFTMTNGTGNCTVNYDQAGSANYNAASTVTETTTATKLAQTIGVTTHAPANAPFNSQFTVAATGGGSGNPVTFSSSGACSNTGATFTMTSGTGSCTVNYDQAGNTNYNAAPTVTETTTATKVAQTINVNTHAPATAVFNASFGVAASAPGGAITYSSTGGCSNSGNTFTMTSGTTACTVKYDQAGNANYNAAPTVTETTTAQKANQTISVTTHAPATSAFNTQFTVAATAPGGAVALSSSGACSNTGATFTMTSGAGTCTVNYDQAGNANYSPAPTVTETTTAQKASQTITVVTHAPATAMFNTSFGVSASAPGGAITFSGSGACSNSGATFTMTSGTGTCTVSYDQAGNANYNAAPTVTETTTAQKASQTITVVTHAPASAVFNTSFGVSASAPGGPISYTSAGACSNSGNTITMTSGTGSCTVDYDQAGSANYNPAPTVTETTSAQKANQTISVTTHAPASAAPNSQFTVAATAPGGAVTYSTSGACTNIGATFTMSSGGGTCSVNYDQAGSADYNPAPQVVETVNGQKLDQTITVNTHAPANAVFGTSFTVAATAPGGAITYTSAGACTNSGANFTITSGTGTCIVNYDQAGNGTYNPAPTVTETVNAQKANQTITVNTHAPATAVFNTSFGVSASAPGGPISYTSAGACSNSGNTITMTSGTGSCTVDYDQAGSANYNPAPTVTETTSAQKASQTITVNTHAPATAVNGSSFTVAASAPGGAVSFSSSGACTNAGAVFTMTAASGTCSVMYDQTGNANYNAAPRVAESTTAVSRRFTLTVTKSGSATGTVTSSPAGISCGATCSADFDEGTTVTLTPAAASGATFAGWSGACSGKGSCSVTMNAAKAVTATFNKKKKAAALACVVPNVKGKPLATARKKIKAAHCNVGKVTRKHSKTVKKGKVVSQRPTPKTVQALGGKVDAVVSKGKR